MNHQNSANLTRHPLGSVREISTLSLPLILSFLSGMLMLFVDRVVLAHYSLEAMNSAAASGILFGVFQFGTMAIAAITEVFVGQFNGAGQKRRCGSAAWQMLYFSSFTILVAWPIAIYGLPYLLSSHHYDHASSYIYWLLLFGPLFPATAAFHSFFIGIGRVRLVLAATLVGNVANGLLDLLLVFGWGPIPAMGVAGASIATAMSQLLQLIILALAFFHQRNKEEYGTHLYQLDPLLIYSMLATGIPSAVGQMVEMAAHALVFRVAQETSDIYLTVVSVGQSLFFLLIFISQGVSKGVAAIAANALGAGKEAMLGKIWFAACRFLLSVTALVAPFLLFKAEAILSLFLPQEQEMTSQLMPLLLASCSWLVLFFLLDGLAWVSAAILTAAGDTLFVMVASIFSSWLFGFAPAALLFYLHGPEHLYWAMVSLMALANLLIFSVRLYSGAWKKGQLLVAVG